MGAVIDPVRDVAIWRWELKGDTSGTTVPDQDPDKDGTAFVLDMRFPGQHYDALLFHCFCAAGFLVSLLRWLPIKLESNDRSKHRPFVLGFNARVAGEKNFQRCKTCAFQGVICSKAPVYISCNDATYRTCATREPLMRPSTHRKLAVMYCLLAFMMVCIQIDATAVCFLSLALLHLSCARKLIQTTKTTAHATPQDAACTTRT